MFTCQVTMKLKANSAAKLTRVIESSIIPMLRQQKGFSDEITYISPAGSEAIDNSFWDTKEDAEAYNRAAYPQVLKALANLLEGNPRVETFKVSNSTFHNIAAKAAWSK
jgi:hypothetical protein